MKHRIAALPKTCLHNNMKQTALICALNAHVSESAIWPMFDAIKALIHTQPGAHRANV